MGKIIALVLMLFTAGCSGPLGASLGALFGAGAMYGGQAFLNRAQEDVEAKIRWRMKKQEYVAEYTIGLLQEARMWKAKENFTGWKKTMNTLLQFHDNQHPETLIMEIKRRLKEREK